MADGWGAVPLQQMIHQKKAQPKLPPSAADTLPSVWNLCHCLLITASFRGSAARGSFFPLLEGQREPGLCQAPEWRTSRKLMSCPFSRLALRTPRWSKIGKKGNLFLVIPKKKKQTKGNLNNLRFSPSSVSWDMEIERLDSSLLILSGREGGEDGGKQIALH